MGTYTIWLAGEDHGLRFRGVTRDDAADYAHDLRKGRSFEIDEPDGSTTYVGPRIKSTHSTWEADPSPELEPEPTESGGNGA